MSRHDMGEREVPAEPLRDKLVQGIGTSFLFVGALVVWTPLTASVGALAGYTTSLLWGNTIGEVLWYFGLKEIALWKLGCAAGFFSGFLRTQTTVQEKKGK